MTGLDLDAIEARASITIDAWLPADVVETLTHWQRDVPALIARVRELETKNTRLGVERVRLHDSLDRVLVALKSINDADDLDPDGYLVAGIIQTAITTNKLPSETGNQS